MEYKIKKTFDRKVTLDFQSYGFSTTLEKTVEVNSAEELQAECDKMFDQARCLTELDIAKCAETIKGQG